MKFVNSKLYGEDFIFHEGVFYVKDGHFEEIYISGQNQSGAMSSLAEDESTIDLQGNLVIPGLIDVHFHGNYGVDFSEGDDEGLITIARYLAQNGITSFSPASLTLPPETLFKAYGTALQFYKEHPEGTAALRGITMEGPFFSMEKRGAQAPEYLLNPDAKLFSELQEAAEGLIRIACVAPELPGALEFIKEVSKNCTVSIAHTTASYEQTKKAIQAGATHLTHLYNAMPPLHHREPGVIGAAAEDRRVMAELICDGIHVHESMVRAAFQLFKGERIILVSDSLSACGMPEGEYQMGGATLQIKGGVAYLSDGKTIAGSITNLFQCMRNAISFGIPAEDAIRAATINPAQAIGAEMEVGSISKGKWADFLVCDSSYNLLAVYIKGKII